MNIKILLDSLHTLHNLYKSFNSNLINNKSWQIAIISIFLLNKKYKLNNINLNVSEPISNYLDFSIFLIKALAHLSKNVFQGYSPWWFNSFLYNKTAWKWHPKTKFPNKNLFSWNNNLKDINNFKTWFSITYFKNPKKINKNLISQQVQTKLELPEFETQSKIITEEIRIFPTKNQKQIFTKWFGTYRFTYNQTITAFNNKEKLNWMELRNKLVVAKGNNLPDWLTTTPSGMRDYAVKEAVTNIKTNLEKNIKFKMKFKNKKNIKQTIQLPKTCFKYNNNKNWIYKDLLGSIRIKGNKQYNLNINHDFKIISIYPDRYYLLIPRTIETENHKQGNQAASRDSNLKVCALDPGLKSFQTGVDIHGNTFQIGKDAARKILDKQLLVDKLKSKLEELKKNKFCSRLTFLKTKKRLYGIMNKIERWKRELHNQSCNWLLKNYDVIYIPNFQVSNMVKKKNTPFNKSLYALSHYEFRMKLINKADRRGKHVIVVTEEYTSKGCSNCGKINNIEYSRWYECVNCKKELDRDLNGAINILQKSIQKA